MGQFPCYHLKSSDNSRCTQHEHVFMHIVVFIDSGSEKIRVQKKKRDVAQFFVFLIQIVNYLSLIIGLVVVFALPFCLVRSLYAFIFRRQNQALLSHWVLTNLCKSNYPFILCMTIFQIDQKFFFSFFLFLGTYKDVLSSPSICFLYFSLFSYLEFKGLLCSTFCRMSFIAMTGLVLQLRGCLRSIICTMVLVKLGLSSQFITLSLGPNSSEKP